MRRSEPESARDHAEGPRGALSVRRADTVERQPVYDTSYVSHRQVAKDCLVSDLGNRYPVPHMHAGRSVTVREPLDEGTIRIFYQKGLIAEHRLSRSHGEMVVEQAHYASLPQRLRVPVLNLQVPAVELTPGPGVGLHHVAPEVEFRPLSIYNAFCEEVAHVASV